jgi:hypothetical protein
MGNAQAVRHLIPKCSRMQAVRCCDCLNLIASQSGIELCHMQERCWLRAVEALGSESVYVNMYHLTWCSVAQMAQWKRECRVLLGHGVVEADISVFGETDRSVPQTTGSLKHIMHSQESDERTYWTCPPWLQRRLGAYSKTCHG